MQKEVEIPVEGKVLKGIKLSVLIELDVSVEGYILTTSSLITICQCHMCVMGLDSEYIYI